MSSDTNPVEVEITAADGHKIIARFFAPGAASGSFAAGMVLLVPAMGVQQDYYAPLASWLAAQGFLTATLDYRGTGRSRRGGLRGFRADILDWARLDCAALIDALLARAPGKPLYWLGHSLGGQILPFVPNRGRITKVLIIASGSGYWRENAPPLKRTAWWLWFVAVPIATRLCGYFPGKRLRKVGDLPQGVIEQWRRWCLDPDYAAGAEGASARAAYAAVATPIVSLSFTDDEFMSERNTESLLSFYRNAPQTLKRIAPADIGARRIGHFGFFRAVFAETLWRKYLLPEVQAK